MTGNAFTFTGGTTGLTFNGAGTTETLGGTLVVANGGTGQTSITGVLVGSGNAITGNPVTQYDVLVGGARNAITSITPSTAGYVLASNGTGANPTFQSIASLGAATTFKGDVGSATPAAGIITFNANTNAGSTVKFVASGTTVDLLVTSPSLFNTTIGLQAGNNAITGSQYIALGYQALHAETTGAQNTAIGYEALQANTAGSGNVAEGYQALKANSTGSNNTAVGWNALSLNTVSPNTAFGYAALQNNVTGVQNTAVGYLALQVNTTGYNTAIGSQALSKNTAGTQNTAIGTASLQQNITGNYNVAVGYQASKSEHRGRV